MLIPLIFDERAPSLSRVPSQAGAGGECHGPLDEGADVRLQGVDVLGQV